MLRKWQAECVAQAMKKYESGSNHFFCQATPGAGKSIMSATLAKALLDKGMIDLILCFSPSVAVADGMRATFSTTINCPFNGCLGSIGQSATLVTYHHEDPQSEIKAYQTGTTQWIVSVGMISEGTDIPRLQVCCHISSVKTELYFRQVLGRILRVNNSPNQQAWLYTFAEQNLIEYAERIEHDIPETCLFVKIGKEEDYSELQAAGQGDEVESEPTKTIKGYNQLEWGAQSKHSNSDRGSDDIYDEIWLGQFRERVVSAFL